LAYILDLHRNVIEQTPTGINQRKADKKAIDFLLENYRNKLLTQNEFLTLKENIEKIIANAYE